jgi:hypothetical protein
MRLSFIAFWLVLMAYVGLLIRLQFPPPIEQRPIIDTSSRNCERLRYHMSEAQVEAVLGGSAGNYRTRGDISYDFGISGICTRLAISPGSVIKEWQTDEALVSVEFEPGKGATNIRRGHLIRRPTWSDALRSRLRDLARMRPNGP